MTENFDKNKGEAMAFFAHEIKNPLAVIKANVQLIELDDDGRNKKSFQAIYYEIENINLLMLFCPLILDENRLNKSLLTFCAFQYQSFKKLEIL